MTSSTSKESQNTCFLVGQRFKVEKLIGKGNFGEIRLGRDIESNKKVAIKIDKNDIHIMLEKEYNFYKSLSKLPGIPKVYYFGLCDKNYAMVMELLGPSLDDLFELCNRKFTLQTMILITIQVLERMEEIHSRGLLHRDIKPQNFLIGEKTEGKHKTIYIIDFGLSKEYSDPKGNHISYRENKKPAGTPRYMSMNTHLKKEQSRRDDLESVGYVLIYLATGALPWQGINAKTMAEKCKKILEEKQSISIEALCKDVPYEYVKYFEHVRALRFDEEPDYEFLKKLFIDFKLKNGFYGDRYDWTDKI